jgi:hypothetical protein
MVRASVVERGGDIFLDIDLHPVRVPTGTGSEVKGAVRLRCVPKDGTPVYVSIPIHFFLSS